MRRVGRRRRSDSIIPCCWSYRGKTVLACSCRRLAVLLSIIPASPCHPVISRQQPVITSSCALRCEVTAHLPEALRPDQSQSAGDFYYRGSNTCMAVIFIAPNELHGNCRTASECRRRQRLRPRHSRRTPESSFLFEKPHGNRRCNANPEEWQKIGFRHGNTARMGRKGCQQCRQHDQEYLLHLSVPHLWSHKNSSRQQATRTQSRFIP